VFSPYYAFARSRGRGDPTNHVAMNVALYGKPRRWAMTERGRASLSREADHIAIGPSAMHWDGAALTITLDETSVPLPSRLRGTVIVRPRAVGGQSFLLDAAGRHRWRPIAPSCDVEVRFEAPDVSWRGTGYLDTNDGDEPLEAAFRSWTWSRFDMERGKARIFYDVVQRDGAERSLSLAIADGIAAPGPALPYRRLPTTGWGIARAAPCDTGAPELLHTMENAPFYARSAIRSEIDGRAATGVHESLSLTRVAAPIVRAMLPFKMPRVRSRP
jgi:carotenoid 1,2-hydratase